MPHPLLKQLANIKAKEKLYYLAGMGYMSYYDKLQFAKDMIDYFSLPYYCHSSRPRGEPA